MIPISGAPANSHFRWLMSNPVEFVRIAVPPWPIEVEGVLVEDRPSRLLGPAVSWAVTFDRGVCPICRVRLQECWGIQNAKPLGEGSHGYTHVTYPALFNLPERLRHRLLNPQKALQMTEPERTAIMVAE